MVKHSPSTSLQFCPRLPWNSELTESSSVLTTSILSNIWYRGKGRCGWEGKVNISIVLTDLFCNETELYPGHILIWYNPGIGKSQLPHVNEFMGTLLVCVLTQSCLTLFNSMDRHCSAPGSSVHGILQARIYWRRSPLPPPGDLPKAGTEPLAPASPAPWADSLLLSGFPGNTAF